ncbi:nucleotidyltransferase family protein [Actinidia rufa]|uniref:Nucleotidyltransferase family protein n=1 Tax=Actinidia rufa TaxID=165716 RepID=A0A7J0G4L7_9ERIC|nr:nucleotidyltransferase family protein [Actinidia rufa]
MAALIEIPVEVKFFDIYGRKLNTSDVGVTCNGAGSFFLKSSKGCFFGFASYVRFNVKGKPFLIAIEDPQAPENDIGKSSFCYFQVRSAFSMALSTLTNVKTILSLGPNRSILGTIIRPDAVLLERKGGSNGEITFNNLLPGAGEPLQANYDDQQEIYCNWQLDDEEAPLPRGNGIRNDGSTPSSSGKKRKAASEEKVAKKVKENGESGKIRHEESDSRKEKGKKKKRWRHNREGSHSNGFRGYVGGSPWG